MLCSSFSRNAVSRVVSVSVLHRCLVEMMEKLDSRKWLCLSFVCLKIKRERKELISCTNLLLCQCYIIIIFSLFIALEDLL